MKEHVECIFNGICHLGEGPVWNVNQGRLFWTDILERKLYVYDPATQDSRVFWEGQQKVGGFAFTRKGGMMLCTDSGVYLLAPDEMGKRNGVLKKLFDVPMVPGELFNDITVDPKGRIFAGTLRSDCKDGTLYRIERAAEPTPVIRHIGCSNGMTFSMDEKTFFHTDSISRTISSYRYDAATGQIEDAAVFFEGDDTQGMPDGITLDTEDHIWAAFWGDSVVRRLSSKGEIVKEIPLPARQPSSVMFGGEDLRDLYITTASQGASDIEKGLDGQGNFLGGHVYRVRTPYKGRPEWLADFD